MPKRVTEEGEEGEEGEVVGVVGMTNQTFLPVLVSRLMDFSVTTTAIIPSVIPGLTAV
ncbi:MAG TPA: hypothetical protein VI794_01095 [Patescibacteria group bacterium]|nr:hypothetical protein [Patescibacteria group bacterium]